MPLYVEIATAFASALVGGDFAGAHERLAPVLRARLSPMQLREDFHSMYAGYSDGDARSISWSEECSMTEWPAKEPVADVGGELLIRAIEWGRP